MRYVMLLTVLLLYGCTPSTDKGLIVVRANKINGTELFYYTLEDSNGFKIDIQSTNRWKVGDAVRMVISDN